MSDLITEDRILITLEEINKNLKNINSNLEIITHVSPNERIYKAREYEVPEEYRYKE